MHPDRFFIEFAAKNVENGQLWAEKLLRLYRKLIFHNISCSVEHPLDPLWKHEEHAVCALKSMHSQLALQTAFCSPPAVVCAFWLKNYHRRHDKSS